ncbi:MAG: phosphoribosylformylglycinamidine cyclo-ligase [Actinomycetota bacterium]
MTADGPTTYRATGVDLEGADRHVDLIRPLVTSTWSARVIGGFGGFAAGVTVPLGYHRPVLMMTTDGVGTKLDLARRTGRWDGVGFDLVAMVVDDLAAAGAQTIGLVDYMAVGALDEERDVTIISSIARACSEAGCPLLGGETAEHPGIMEPDQVDLAATGLGVVEHGQELGAHRVAPGDLVIGLASPNLRSNGYSLVRAIIGDRSLDDGFPGAEASIGEVLLDRSVVYAPAVISALSGGGVKAGAHITGGGLIGNLPRILPTGLGVILDQHWPVPETFRVLQRWGDVSDDEMVRVFNLGIGFCLIVSPDATDRLCAEIGHQAQVIGRVISGSGVRVTSRS